MADHLFVNRPCRKKTNFHCWKTAFNTLRGTQITKIEPKQGSLSGETRLVIEGVGFSEDTYNEGNKVQLVSNERSYECNVNKDSTTEGIITCYTPANMVEDYYYVRVNVDGRDVPIENHCRWATDSNCRFRAHWGRTPTITSIEPTAGLPGSIIKINGKLFTDRYGSQVAESSNGRTERILSYGIELSLNSNNKGDNGYMKCKTQGNFVGHSNVSYIVEGEYGRAYRDRKILHVYTNDQIATYQTHAEITSVSPPTGSLEGDTMVTITGNFFDQEETKSKTKVTIAGTDCEVQYPITDTQIVCKTIRKPDMLPELFAGSRGLMMERWNATSKGSNNLPDVDNLDDTAADYSSWRIDSAYFYEEQEGGEDRYVSKVKGIFVPPKTGEYSFHVQGDDGAHLLLSNTSSPEFKETIASSPYNSGNKYTTYPEQGSTRRNLQAGQGYYLEAWHRENVVHAQLKIAARYYGTKMTNHSTGQVEQENQIVKIKSSVLRDIQNLTLNGFTSTATAVSETQVVNVIEGSGERTSAQFRLGLYEVYTKKLSTTSTSVQIQNALKELPIVHSSESFVVTVSAPATGAGAILNIVFVSKRGEFPLLTFKNYTGSSPSQILEISVTRRTMGTPSGEFVVLSMDNKPSPMIPITASAQEVQDALNSMFKTRCHKSLNNNPAKTLHYDFETNPINPVEGGMIYTEMEAFCGSKMVKNPGFLYRDDAGGLLLGSSLNTVCFAYHGLVTNYIYLYYSYTSAESVPTGPEYAQFSFPFNGGSGQTAFNWVYVCFDMLTALKNYRVGGNSFLLKRIQLIKEGDGDLFIDEVYIGRQQSVDDPDDVNDLRLAPAKANNFLIDSVSVNKFVENGNPVFEVELTPVDCGCGLPAFSTFDGQLLAGMSVQVQRPQLASCAITGSFTVSFANKQKSGISVASTAEEFRNHLRSIPEMGDVYVYKHGKCDDEIKYSVAFLSNTGDQEEIQVTSQLQGTGVTIETEVVTDGSVWFDPIQGDMLRLIYDDPQVNVKINDVPSICSGSCTYQWTEGSTPNITDITPTTGISGTTEVTIDGTGFQSDHSKNKVMIGGATCTTKASSTTTQLVCDVGDGPRGAYPVQVTVEGKGAAQNINDGVKFTYQFSITAAAPLTCGVGGGCEVTLSGYGFSSSDVVKIGTATCMIKTQTSTQIKCLAPANSVGTHTLKITHGDNTDSTQTYNFVYAAQSMQISSVSPTVTSVAGGDTLTLSGTGLDDATSLMICDEVVTMATQMPNQVTATLPAHAPATCTVRLLGSSGWAVKSDNTVPTITYNLKLQNINPTRGSIHGGTLLTLTGEGFSTDKNSTMVKVGSHDCHVEDATANQIICKVADTGKVHRVDNTGFHYEFFEGFAWKPENLENVEVGDIVEWSWTYPNFVEGMEPKVEQVLCTDMTTLVSGGFSSGEGVKTGRYVQRMVHTGEICVSSGYIDKYRTTMFMMRINVVDRLSSAVNVTLRVGDYEAEYDVNSGVSAPSDSGPCTGFTGKVSGCSDAEPSSGSSSNFNFNLYTCSTPKVTSVTPNKGTTETLITVTGTGFQTTKCRNEVYFGDSKCNVQTSTATSIVCKIDPQTSPSIGILNEVSLRVHNLGNGHINIRNPLLRAFALEPVVTSVTPNQGSLSGGTLVTLTGTGFQGDISDISVTVGGFTAEVTQVSYEQLVLKTPMAGAGVKTIAVSVRSTVGTMVPATCTPACLFTLSSAVTPTMTLVDPMTLTGAATTLTISGSKFGAATQNADVMVTVGGETCTVSNVTDTSIECSITNVPAGNNVVMATIKQFGAVSGTLSVQGQKVITDVSPAEGSTNGGTEVVVTGNGFIDSATTVSIDGTDCPVTMASLSMVKCITKAHVEGAVNLVVTSSGQAYPQQDYNYTATATPSVTVVSPVKGSGGTTVAITGTGFSTMASDNNVYIGSVPCIVQGTPSSTSITCIAGANTIGDHDVLVNVTGKGLSNNNKQFEYELAASGITPSQGSTSGGQKVTVAGSGLDGSTKVEVCGQLCVRDDTTTTSQHVCYVPAAEQAVSTTLPCDVVISNDGVNITLANSYMYSAALTPSITAVAPSRGSTAGGTRLTIDGSGFGNTPGDLSVSVADVSCAVVTATNNQVTCDTGAVGVATRSKVRLERNSNGIADQTNADFHYVDVWSSQSTWGNNPLPVEGDLVVIEANQSVLLDMDTPKLKMILVKGGELIFDDKDITLRAEHILVTDGGLFQIGTEEKPFEHQAVVKLYGNARSKELPIYGVKNLGIRDGRLELHGKFIPITWTRLASTVTAGSDTIVLQDEVTWQAGDEVAIATTSHRHSQGENEKCTIKSIANDKKTITCEDALTYEHLGVSETFDGTTLDFRAEVGLLTHNVKVIGDDDKQWAENIEACPDGFDSGEFKTQTCFLGKFGEDTGSDEFGGHILIHAPRPDEQLAVAHIEFIEVRHAGQAFRLGRYPIHFHLNGDMSGSYVRGVGIHSTFNRAVNIHGTHNVLVERIVIFDVRGGAIFLEDGIETGNIFIYNLAIFVHMSTSLLNDDITPAAFWATNPNNTYMHNAVAGGTHFGWWYRMHEHPDGPSATTTICPRKVELGPFFNNTVHSQGWFGLWVFETYTPKVGSSCSSTVPSPAVFKNIFVYNCDKGVEFVNTGALQLQDSYLVNNRDAGWEVKIKIDGDDYSDDGLLINNTMIVGHATSLTRVQQGCTRRGLVWGYGTGIVAKKVTFVNFDENNCAGMGWARIAGTCAENCGGYNVATQELRFVNAPHKGFYEWTFEGQIKDRDGTLIGTDATKAQHVGKTVITCSNTLPPDCVAFPDFKIIGADNPGMPACICPSSRKFHRFAFNNISPDSLLYKDIILRTQYGNQTMPYKKKSVSHQYGWHTVNVDGLTTSLEFENADQITNISYTGVHYEYDDGDYIVFTQNSLQKPDRFIVDGTNHINVSETTLDPATSCSTGDWTWDYANSQISFTICGGSNKRRKKRGSPPVAGSPNNINMNFKAYKCFYKDCNPPPDPNTVPPVDERPDPFQLWSATTTWEESNGVVTSVSTSDGTYGLPQDGDNVTIEEGTWVVADTNLPWLGTLILKGGLELDSNNGARDFTLNCTYIIILGGRLVVGFPEEPFLSTANIVLRGSHSTPEYPHTTGPVIGSKVIAVFGGLDLHGIDVGRYWTTLASPASVGDTTVTLSQAVDWSTGSQVVIATTSFNITETEIRTIQSVSGDKLTLTLDRALSHRHISHTEQADGWTLEMKAEVGLLTRNVKVIGEAYNGMEQESFGARIIVGRTSQGSTTYIGYARISNTEFYRTGQEGWVESYDPRFSVAWSDLGAVSNVRPSYVKKSAFHHGFSPAIGAYSTDNLPIEDNVIHGTVWFCMQSNSHNTQVRRNLCAHVQFEGSYQDRFEILNIRYNGAFSFFFTTGLVLEGNHAAGYERVGFHVPPESCDTVSANPYRDNAAHSGLMGLSILPQTSPLSGTCVRYSNFEVWKNANYGLYVNGKPSMRISGIKSADNGVGVFTFIHSPPAVAHLFENKDSLIHDSFFVGRSDSFDCTTDVVDSKDPNIMISNKNGGQKCDTSRYIGVVMTSFMSSSNNAPEKPLCGILSYQAIAGLSKMEDVTFSKFNDKCGAGTNIALAPNNNNDDGIHPMRVRNITFASSVDDRYKYRNARANVAKINPTDCFDMQCDGLLKCLIEDLDGTFLGSIGSIISESEFDYNVNGPRGLGDFRIPKTMATALDGTKIPYRTLAPNQGIVRNSGAQLNNDWQAYEVHDLTYRMLVLESLDKDTESRRLSPIAILSDGYLDLINGPQDHGWCSGYACRRRLSTFPILVAIGKEYLIHLSSTNPQQTRFFLLNSDPNEAVVISMFFMKQNTLDLYCDDTYVIPKNGRWESPDGVQKLIMDPPPNGNRNFYKPSVNDARGANYYNRNASVFSFVLKGPNPCTLKMRPTIVVSHQFPPMTLDEFYGQQMIQNLASFLNVPFSKVRFVDIVPDNSASGRRRKRDTGSVVIVGAIVEVGDNPEPGINDTTANGFTYSELNSLLEKIQIEIQLGNYTDIINASSDTIISVAPALPPPDDPAWEQAAQDNTQYTVVVQVSGLQFNPPLVPLHENTMLQTQPKVMVVDRNGNRVRNGSPWQLTATLRSGTGNAAAQLLGNTTVTIVDGWANYTDLLITYQGVGYIIDFQITDPVEGENFTIASDAFTIPSRPIRGGLSYKDSSMYHGENVRIELNLVDSVTNAVIEDIAWRNHVWSVSVTLAPMEDTCNATLEGTTQSTFSPSSGKAVYNALRLTQPGMFVLRFTITTGESTPEYSITYDELVEVMPVQHRGMTHAESRAVTMRFDADYGTIVGSSVLNFRAFMGCYLTQTYPSVVISGVAASEGSIIVTYNMEGNMTEVNTTIYSVCGTIDQQTSFTFNTHTLQLSGYLLVDGDTFYGTSCGSRSSVSTAEENKFPLAVIIAVVIVSVVILIIVMVFVAWKCKVKPRTKTYDVNSVFGSRSEIDDILFREKTFMSIKSNHSGGVALSVAPAATKMTNGLSNGHK
ncbi:hypothetical protein FSP39_005622 [Pinctada imbricata]|uniref:Fibrocystin-L n=1 Tax=Pinctada imbricata TaxID=66713 RepID=A0AA88YVJ8_PINIB|nr:hypothetical protein FSP39_005622 [Pinctada imbricata]